MVGEIDGRPDGQTSYLDQSYHFGGREKGTCFGSGDYSDDLSLGNNHAFSTVANSPAMESGIIFVKPIGFVTRVC